MNERPMPSAELDDCCGQYRWDDVTVDDPPATYCENCPLIIERLERQQRVMRAARAM